MSNGVFFSVGEPDADGLRTVLVYEKGSYREIAKWKATDNSLRSLGECFTKAADNELAMFSQDGEIEPAKLIALVPSD